VRVSGGWVSAGEWVWVSASEWWVGEYGWVSVGVSKGVWWVLYVYNGF